MKIEERESACFDLLKRLHRDKYVLIGGYAVSAFDFPRFSVDLDIAIKEEELEIFTDLLEGQGYSQAIRSDKFSWIYKGEFIRFEREVSGLNVSADLLVNVVQSRQTSSAYSFEYLFKNSEMRKVIGYSQDLAVKARVADREMLIALKANSMRLADQRDIIALCNGKVDVEKVAKHLERCPKDVIKENIRRLLATIEDPKQKDSIKGVFGVSDKLYERVISRAEAIFMKLERVLN
ncbi:MAG: hypothetical protein U9Q76_08690 [candidate division WOR-3 bacterium]|nr:hypothetical protein [candidate division WOR-3 bacterium]